MAKFYLKSKAKSDGERLILVSKTFGHDRWLTSTGFSIAPSFWDDDKQRVKEGTRQNPVTNKAGITGKTINARLNLIDATFSKLDNQDATRKDYEIALHEITGKVDASRHAQKSEVLKCYDEFLRSQSKAQLWADKTAENYEGFTHHLSSFKKDLKFADFDEEGLQNFANHLRDEGLSERTARRYFRRLTTFLRYCTRKGLCAASDISKETPKFHEVKKEVIYLTEEEITLLYNLNIPPAGTRVTLKDHDGKSYTKRVAKDLQAARDMLLFCCFTGLRYSDMQRLRPMDVKVKEGRQVLQVVTKKTKDSLTIPLTDKAKTILERYTARKEETIFPQTPNVTMNYRIKDVCELAGINELTKTSEAKDGKVIEEERPKFELITTHVGRKTFVVSALSKGAPERWVMKITGHSDYNSMKPYIDVAKSKIYEVIDMLNF